MVDLFMQGAVMVMIVW